MKAINLETTIKNYGKLKCFCSNEDLNRFTYIKINNKDYAFQYDTCQKIGGTTSHDSPDIAYMRMFDDLVFFTEFNEE